MISGVKYLSWACWPLHIFLRKIYIYNLYPCFNWLVFWDFELHALWAHQLAQFSLVTQSSPTLCDSMIAARQASLSITNTWSSLKLMFIESVMPSGHLILCHPLLLLPPIPPSIRAWTARLLGQISITRLPCPSPTPRAYSNSCSSSRWCHPTILSSVTPFSSCLLSFPPSGLFF